LSLKTIFSFYECESITEPLESKALARLYSFYDKKVVDMLMSKGVILAGGMALALADPTIEDFRIGDGDFYVLGDNKELFKECALLIEEMMQPATVPQDKVVRTGLHILDFHKWKKPLSLIIKTQKTAEQVLWTYNFGYVQCAIVATERTHGVLEFGLIKTPFAQECIEAKTNLYFSQTLYTSESTYRRILKIYDKGYSVDPCAKKMSHLYLRKVPIASISNDTVNYSLAKTGPYNMGYMNRHYLFDQMNKITRACCSNRPFTVKGQLHPDLDLQAVQIDDEYGQSVQSNPHSKHRYLRIGGFQAGWGFGMSPCDHRICAYVLSYEDTYKYLGFDELKTGKHIDKKQRISDVGDE